MPGLGGPGAAEESGALSALGSEDSPPGQKGLVVGAVGLAGLGPPGGKGERCAVVPEAVPVLEGRPRRRPGPKRLRRTL